MLSILSWILANPYATSIKEKAKIKIKKATEPFSACRELIPSKSLVEIN